MRRRLQKVLVPVLFVGAAGAALAAEGERGVYGLEEVARGQRGYGLSVFSGVEPESFEVEVIGVWRNVRPDTSYILARLSGRGLEVSGVAAGMSGSPVYIDDRLAGAVAFAWPFSHDAIAGITPIQPMRDLIDSPGAMPRTAIGEPRFELSDIVSGSLSVEPLERRLAMLRPALVGGATSGVQWVASGFGDLASGILAKGVGDVAPAGFGAETSGELVPGGSVAAVLINGDLGLAATGTVTDRLDDAVLAFGHTFLGLGSAEIPMATAEVITVLSSRMSSFKIANVGEVVGAIDYDHATGIRGHVGRQAPTLPIRVTVDGEETNVRVADLPMFTPTLLAMSVLGAIDISSSAVGNQALDITAHFDLGAAGELNVRQSFDGPSSPVNAAVHLLSLAGFLLQNSFQEVEVGAIDVVVTRFPEPRTARLVGAHAAGTLVRPGDTVGLNVDLVAHRGEALRRSISVELPANLPDGRYSLLVGDGANIDAARFTVERSAPVSFAQALQLLNSLQSRRQLAVLGVFADRGLAVAGSVLPRLPGSLMSLWGAASSNTAAPLGLAVAQSEVVELDLPVEGILRVDLQVERRGPLAQEGNR